MKRTVKFLALAAAVLMALLLSACAPKMTADEVKAALPQLIDESKTLNDIYFGEGFEIDGSISDVTASGGYYYCDCTKYELYSVSDIKDATEKVFTPEYAEILYQAAFDGVTTDSAVRSARYIEGELGLMQKASDDIYELENREFDYDSLAIVKNGSERVTVTVDTYIDGEKDDTLTLIVVRYGEEGSYSYRLDSPTY